MFYSHQLLSKKGPLGQIWIAATMKVKINRKKTEQIDIEESCMQILQPQVPLALRLSGILMGGVVLIFHRKVKFLHDDVTEFLSKIKTALSTRENDHIVSLPKGKSHARYENVTISYDFDVFGDIERPLMQPRTPERRDSDEDLSGGNEYVMVSRPWENPPQLLNMDFDSEELYLQGLDHLQADRADITLEENIASSNNQFYGFGMDIQEERFPVIDPDQMHIDQVFPDLQLSDEINPQLSTAIESNSAEYQGQQPAPEQDPRQDLQQNQLETEEPVGPESPEHGEATAAAAPAQKKRRRGARGKHNSELDECTEIPATEFELWLRNPEDIVGRGKSLRKDSRGLWIQNLFQLPSASISYNHRIFTAELTPDWTSQLTNLWHTNIGTKLPQGPGPKNLGVHRGPDASPSLPNTSFQNDQVTSYSNPNPSHDHGEPAGASGEFYSNSSSETRMNIEPVIGRPQEVPTGDGSSYKQQVTKTSVERLRVGQPDLKEYGSVEKLRTALQSPSTGSDHLWDSQLGLTPRLSGQFATNSSGRPNRCLSTPGSGKLPFDIEVEPFINGGSGRFKKARLSSPAMGSGDLPENDYFFDIPAPDDIGRSDYFASLRESLRGSLSQFELLVETGPSTQAARPQEDLNNVSLTVLQCLRENFIDLGAQCKEHQSLDDLSQGMDRSQAAKCFYQILVLASNNYLTVSQDIPFGDILISRGLHL